jgi:signal transduction histidine kinase
MAEGTPEWRPPRWVTLWVPVVVSLLVQVPAAFWIGRLAGDPPREILLAAGIAVVGPVALIAARRLPGPVVAIVSIAASVDLLLNDRAGPPYVALAFAIIGAIVRGARIWAWISIAVCWVGTVTFALVSGREDWTPWRVAGTTLGILVVLGIGEGIRSRRDRIDEFRRLAGERRQSEVQAERVRIARELHDVLAHSLSQINVQAGVGLHLMERQPAKAAEALANIRETSKTALDEVRSVLGVLRADTGESDAPFAPEPDLARLPELAAATPGIRIDLENDVVDAPRAVQLALYRIVQESLTNVTRHAAATRVRVRLWRDDRAYRLEVRDDGTGPAAASETGGRGLLGMRERAELLGGRLTAGPAAGGGFLVDAEIPLDRREASS